MLIDIHNHVVFGVDDGSRDRDSSLELIDIAYSGGTRVMCCTPHVYPEYFGDNSESILKNFELLREVTSKKYPDMFLCLGSEMFYTQNFAHWIKDGKGFTLNGTDSVLVEFSVNDSCEKIEKAISHILNSGYRPIIAHPERYENFGTEYSVIERMKTDGVLIQCDSGAFIGEYGRAEKKKSRQLLKRGLVDMIASDAHSPGGRNTDLRSCFKYISDKFGDACADRLFRSCPAEVLGLDIRHP